MINLVTQIEDLEGWNFLDFHKIFYYDHKDSINLIPYTDVRSIKKARSPIMIQSAVGNLSSGKYLYFFDTVKHLPKHIIRLINSGHLKLIVTIGENIWIDSDGLFKEIKSCCRNIGLDAGLIDYRWLHPTERRGSLKISYMPIAEQAMRYALRKRDIVTEINFSERTKKYTCLNNISKFHRLKMVLNLIDNGLLDYGYVSYLNYYPDEDRLSEEWQEWNIESLTDISYSDFIERYMPLLKADNAEYDVVHRHGNINKMFFGDAYWSIICETWYENKFRFSITEKTFKSIANLQPFIVCGQSGVLKELKNLGYETFGKYVDESYDDIRDETERLDAVIAETNRIISLSDREHMLMTKDMAKLLIHNQNIFFNKKWKII